MDFEEMKLAWQQLNQRMDQQLAISQKQFKDTQTTKARHALRPLIWRQIFQDLFGVMLILMAVVYWSNHDEAHQLLSGLIVHGYGILTVILAGMTLSKISRIDYAAPVAAIQKQLAQLRTFTIRSGAAVGLPWWLLWMPVIQVLCGLLGGDVYAMIPPVVTHVNIVVGVIGWLTTWWLHNRSHARISGRLDDSFAGDSLAQARKHVEEISQFEKE